MRNFKKIGMLQGMCNKFGDFKIATHFPDGRWTRHVSVLHCWENLEKESWRLETANNRQIFPCEIVLDIDPHEGEDLEHVRGRFDFITQTLDQEEFQYYAYFSGSRGYHIHLIFPDALLYGRRFREMVKRFFIAEYGADLMKKSERSMIALENTPHWKTNHPKTLIRRRGRLFYDELV